jgi:xylulokinase
MSSSSEVSAFLGIDLGTSQVKALLIGPDGQVLGRGSAPYPVDTPEPGHAETDPELWWRATGTAVRQAKAAATDAEGAKGAEGANVAALALAGQMHGVVLAARDGTPIRPATLWLDRRAAAEAARYASLPEELTAPLGNRPSPGMAGPILRWLATNEPAAMRKARWALQPKDWLRLRLTGESATDPTDASGTLLFYLIRGSWATDLIEALGLPAEILPVIRDPAEIAGRLRPDAAAHLGLRPGIPVATGAADTAAALFAARLPADAALLTLGTGGQWIIPSAWRPTATTNLFRAIGPGGTGGCGTAHNTGLYRLAALQNMGETINWVRTILAVSWDHAYSTAARPWQEDTPVFLPYLAEERFPAGGSGGRGGWGAGAPPAGRPSPRASRDPNATGCWAGLTLAHRRDDLLRAALEGLAFLLRDRLGDLRAAGHDPARVMLGGGGSGHPAWRQLLADVLGLPLYPVATGWPATSPGAAGSGAAGSGADGSFADTWDAASWLSATGAALLAAVATGVRAGGVSGDRSEEKKEAVTPRQPDAASAGYGRYLTLKASQAR